MKHMIKLILVFLLFFTSLFASQEQTNNIAQISSSSLYNIDKNSLQTTIKAYVRNYSNLKALKIVEALSGETYLSIYVDDKGNLLDKALPNDLSNYTLFEADSFYQNELVGKVYVYYENKNQIKLTIEEINWLKRNPPIQIAVVENYPPYDFRDRNNKLSGFHSDILNIMNKNLGANIKIKAFKTWSEAYNSAVNGSVNAIFSLSYSKDREEKYFIYSPPYHFSPYYLVVDKNNTDITSIQNLMEKNVSIEKDTIFNKVVEELVPSANIVYAKDTKQAYDFVKTAKTIATISPNINDELFKKSGLKVASEIYHKSSDLYIGTNKNQPIVASILKKGIDSISLKDITSLRQKWFTKTNATIELNGQEKQWIKNNPEVKVIKFFDEPPFTLNGTEKSGYIYELLEYLIKSAGLNIKYLDGFTSYDSMLKTLVKGDVDILTTFPTSLDLGNDSNIVKSKSILKTPFVLVSTSNNKEIEFVEELFGKKVAVVKGYVQDKYLSDFPQIEKVYVNNNEEGFNAIRSGKAQFYINNKANTDYVLSKSFATDLKINYELPYSTFPPLSISFAMNGKKETLVSILNKALEQVPYKKIKSIRDKWIITSQKDSSRIIFTPQEQEFLIKNPNIILGADQNWQPFDFRNKFGKHSGFDADYLELLRKKLGIDIKVELGAWGELQKKVKDKKLAGLVGPAKTQERDEYMSFTEPYYMLSQIVLVGSNTPKLKSMNDLNDKTLAIKSGNSNIEIISKKYPKIKQKVYKNYGEIIRAVSLGEVDAGLSNVGAASYEMEKNFISNLKSGLQFGNLNDMRFGIRKDWPELVSILQKGMDAISQEELNVLLSKWLKLSVSQESKKVAFTPQEKEWLESNPYIRIAMMNYWETNDNGESIHTEFVKLINKYGNLNINLAKYNTWKNGFADASNGSNIHGILNLAWSNSREKIFNYVKGYNYNPHYLVVNKSNNEITGLDSLVNQTVYVKQKHISKTRLEQFSKDIKIVELEDNQDIIEKLSKVKGNESAIISNFDLDTLEKYNLKIVKILYDKFNQGHLGINKKHPELISILEKVFTIIPAYEINNLQNKVYKKTEEIKVELSEKEKEFLKQKKTIRVHNEKSWPPFNFHEFGQAKGYSVDLIKLVAKNTGLNIEFITGPTWDEFLSMMKEDKLDLMINIVVNEKREKYLDFTDPFIQATMGIAVSDKNTSIKTYNDILDKKVALENGFFYHDYFLENHPETPLVVVDNGLQTLQAVSFNKADATIGFVPVMKYISNKNFITGLNYFTDTNSPIMKPVPLRFATQKNQPELLSILQKGLASIKPEQMQELAKRWLGDGKEEVNNLNLSQEEKNWIRENRVKVGVEEWAPVIFSHGGSDFDGITGDILRLIIEKTGLQFDVTNRTWNVLLKKFKDKELDLLPATYYTDDRATYGLFSDGYYKMLDYIYVKEDNKTIKSLDDLKGKTLAIPKDFATIPKIKANFPEITIVETRDQIDSMQRVLKGEVDALYDSQIAIEYKMQEALIVGLKGIPQKSFDAAPLHMFSHIDKPILRDILNKALRSIPPYEINKIKLKWLVEKRNERIQSGIEEKKDNKETLKMLTVAVGVFLFLLLVLIIITKFISDDFVAKSFGSSKFRVISLIILSVVILMLSVLVNITLKENKKSILESSKGDLEFVLQTTQGRLDTWIDERKNYLNQIGRDTKLVLLVEELLKVKPDQDSLAFSIELQAIRDYFEEREKEFGNLGFFIINKDFISIGSRRDSNLGTKNLIAAYNSELLQKVFDGESVFIPPIESDVAIKTNSKNEHTMFFAIPVKDKDNNVIAILTQRLDVEGKFSDIVQTGRIGKSGESYIFSKDGYMLTKSRFRDELIDLGLLKDGEKEYEQLLLKDPGGDLREGFKPDSLDKLPFTKMVQKAISLDETTLGNYSNIFSNIEGYRDYRGVDVLGAWIWYKKYGFGLTTEVDKNEALSNYNILRQNLLIITVLTILLTIMSVVMLIILGEKATRSVNRANEELNKLLDSFDDNVIASKTDARGIIKYASKAFCEISGYTEKELIGSPQNIVRHPDMPKEIFKGLWQTIQSGKTWRGEVKNKKKDGGFYWVDVVIEPEFDEKGEITGYSAIRQDITSKKEVEELSKNLELKVEDRTAELTKSQQQFTSMVSNVPGVIYRCLLDENWTMLFISDEIENLSGYPASDFLNNKNKTFADIMHPDDIEDAAKVVIEKIKRNEKYYVEYRIITKDGDIKWVSGQGKPIYDKDGKVGWLDGAIFDIDENKRAQEAIKDQKQYTDSIMNSQNNIVISTDGEKLRTANKAFMDFFEVNNVEEFLENIGDCICDTFDAELPEEFLQKMMGEEKWIEYVYNRPDMIHKARIERHGQMHIFTITSDRFEFAGEMLEVAVFTDITEIEAIRKNIETILSNIMLPVLITSKEDRTILYANEYASIQYESPIEKLVGSSIDNVYTSLNQKDKILLEMEEDGFVENLEERYRTWTGKEFIGLLSVKPIVYNGEDAYIGMVVDITKQKEIEDEIREIHKHTQSSIEYASLIQHSLIPSNDLFRKYFDDYFTIWHPKDIVGGDIYLFEELRHENECLLMVIDCTGHGVPGAFVTMLVKAIERQVAAVIASDPNLEVSPAWILKYFNQTMKKLLKQEDEEAISNAGFDGAVLYYNKAEQIVRFAGAELPLFYVEDGEFKTIKGNRQSIGYKKSDANYEFKEHIIEVKDGMQFYLTSDGYLDQNGGDKGFPFGKKRFLKILDEYKDYSFADQQEVLLNELQEYQKDEERNDDVSIIGIKIGKNSFIKKEQRENWII